MHATSAIALAVVALSTASTLASAQIPAGELYERDVDTYEYVRRAPTVIATATELTPRVKSSANPTTVIATATELTPPVKSSANPKDALVPSASGSIRTMTHTARARPTACKEGEKPSYDRKRGGLGRSSRGIMRASGKKPVDAKKPLDAPAAAPQPAVVARAVAAPTPTTKVSSGGPNAGPKEAAAAPTAAPTPVPGTGTTSADPAKVLKSVTRVGKDKKTTVHLLVNPTTTRCYTTKPTQKATDATGTTTTGTAPKAAGVKATAHAAANLKQSPLGSGAATLKPTKTAADAKLAARAIELVERYFGELDELD